MKQEQKRKQRKHFECMQSVCAVFWQAFSGQVLQYS